ncbi:hypothetical protein [Dysgonomonas sp. ZJ279]|uniref:hypothetical protein n=1 Tax=Dysgonomonas sp. ZJ279 TaxID=2709796 RepID=UPI0021053ECD|nr:hypothetical protein [Dysgonomonas sp. ZJ279]
MKNKIQYIHPVFTFKDYIYLCFQINKRYKTMQESFKNRVTKFWKTFTEEESQIREMMDNKVEGQTLLNFVDSILQISFHTVYFEMGINKENKYELILTPEGNRAKLIPLYYWLQHAPAHLWEKWNFYASKPGKASPGSTISMYDINLTEDNIEIYAEVDQDRKKINLEVYAPVLMTLEENKRYSIFFIYLDQFIGEVFTMEIIGYIDFITEKSDKHAVKISGLTSVIEEAMSDDEDWPKIDNPCELYSGYKMNPTENKEWKLREDIQVGYTSCSPILNDFYGGTEEAIKGFEEDGIVYGFIFFENTNVPQENIVQFRADIEDKIMSEIVNYSVANSTGGATGFHFSYIDFIIYDIDTFLKVSKEILSHYKFEEVGFSRFVLGDKPILFN